MGQYWAAWEPFLALVNPLRRLNAESHKSQKNHSFSNVFPLPGHFRRRLRGLLSNLGSPLCDLTGFRSHIWPSWKLIERRPGSFELSWSLSLVFVEPLWDLFGLPWGVFRVVWAGL